MQIRDGRVPNINPQTRNTPNDLFRALPHSPSVSAESVPKISHDQVFLLQNLHSSYKGKVVPVLDQTLGWRYSATHS
jgi:hypothetical protein